MPGSPDTGAREPLDNEGVLWVAALDRVPIEERIEWVATMKRRVDALNAQRALAAGVGVPPDADLGCAPAKERQDARGHAEPRCVRHGAWCPCPRTCPCWRFRDCDDGGARVEAKWKREHQR